jgi:hypothetical protein
MACQVRSAVVLQKEKKEKGEKRKEKGVNKFGYK